MGYPLYWGKVHPLSDSTDRVHPEVPVRVDPTTKKMVGAAVSAAVGALIMYQARHVTHDIQKMIRTTINKAL